MTPMANRIMTIVVTVVGSMPESFERQCLKGKPWVERVGVQQFS